jgi:hypothetical protein
MVISIGFHCWVVMVIETSRCNDPDAEIDSISKPFEEEFGFRILNEDLSWDEAEVGHLTLQGVGFYFRDRYAIGLEMDEALGENAKLIAHLALNMSFSIQEQVGWWKDWIGSNLFSSLQSLHLNFGENHWQRTSVIDDEELCNWFDCLNSVKTLTHLSVTWDYNERCFNSLPSWISSFSIYFPRLKRSHVDGLISHFNRSEVKNCLRILQIKTIVNDVSEDLLDLLGSASALEELVSISLVNLNLGKFPADYLLQCAEVFTSHANLEIFSTNQTKSGLSGSHIQFEVSRSQVVPKQSLILSSLIKDNILKPGLFNLKAIHIPVPASGLGDFGTDVLLDGLVDTQARIESLELSYLCLSTKERLRKFEVFLNCSQNLSFLSLHQLRISGEAEPFNFFFCLTHVFEVELSFLGIPSDLKEFVLSHLLCEGSEIQKLTCYGFGIGKHWIDQRMTSKNFTLCEPVSIENCALDFKRNAWFQKTLSKILICLRISMCSSVFKDYSVVKSISNFLFSHLVYEEQKSLFHGLNIPCLLSSSSNNSKKRKSLPNEDHLESAPKKHQTQSSANFLIS